MNHRITVLKCGTASGDFILYWMQASVRVGANLALAEACRVARESSLPLAVLFCLDTSFPESNARSFAFLLDGLEDVGRTLQDRGLRLTVAYGSPEIVVPIAARGARVVVFDKGYLPIQRRWRSVISSGLEAVIEVEDNVSVPVDAVSDHEEWSAATLRPKLMKLATLEPFPKSGVYPISACSSSPHIEERWRSLGLKLLDQRPHRSLVALWSFDSEVKPTEQRGGETVALQVWESFLAEKLDRYDSDRNDPGLDGQSGLAPYLHFGHLTPLTLLMDLKQQNRWTEPLTYRRAGEDSVAKFLDEVLVRRELSVNFVWNNPGFSTFAGLPNWALKTLANHESDRRDYSYTDAEWESATTHDEVWNAAQIQLVSTGTMHGYLRMYWGKKLLEWNKNPAEAFALALRLNNKYALDGRDPNSYSGVAWCFGKHDRPWKERAVYGLVRCMTSGGLARKFDLSSYLRRYSPLNFVR